MIQRMTAIVAAALVAVAGGAGTAYAQDQAPAEKPAAKESAKKTTLKVGDRAPELHIAKWVKGEPITGFEKGKTYVVEFWATWCGPCIASMPHLTELQKEYRDNVTIIGVTTKDPNNSLEQVEKMVSQKGDAGMGYTVGFDDGTQTKEAFFKAAGQRGIPAAFVVDSHGIVQYIGHPMWLDLVLEPVVKGTWDAKTGAEKIAKAEEAMGEIYGSQDPAEQLAKIKQVEKDYPAVAPMFSDLKYTAMVKTNDPKASEVGRQLMNDAVKAKDAQKLNAIAWGIVDPDADIDHRDLDLATVAATKAVELTESKDGAIMDTLAWCYFRKGDAAKAIELEKKAIDLAPDQMKDQLKESLEKFQEKSK